MVGTILSEILLLLGVHFGVLSSKFTENTAVYQLDSLVQSHGEEFLSIDFGVSLSQRFQLILALSYKNQLLSSIINVLQVAILIVAATKSGVIAQVSMLQAVFDFAIKYSQLEFMVHARVISTQAFLIFHQVKSIFEFHRFFNSIY